MWKERSSIKLHETFDVFKDARYIKDSRGSMLNECWSLNVVFYCFMSSANHVRGFLVNGAKTDVIVCEESESTRKENMKILIFIYHKRDKVWFPHT